MFKFKLHSRFRTYAAGVAVVFWSSSSPYISAQNTGDQRPRLSLRARPDVVVAPGRVVLTAELTGGASDFREYYCPTVEWDWGDGTRSESTSDCDPYEAGKSEIRRRFTTEHVFRRSAHYRVYIRLKQRDDEVAAASTNIVVRPGGPEL